MRGNATVVEVLVEHGAHLDARDAAGRTALDLVLEPGRNENPTIAALLRRLAGE